MLRDYEILYLLRPDLDEAQVKEAVASVDKLIENVGGIPQKTNVWGLRKLAYEVKHLREAQYVLTEFQLDTARVPEMDATLKISDTVFRHLITRRPPEAKTASAKAKAEPPATTVSAPAPAPVPAPAPAAAPAAEATSPDGASAEGEPQP